MFVLWYVLFCKNNRSLCSIEVIERIVSIVTIIYILYIYNGVFFRIVEVDKKCFTDDSTSCAAVLENVTGQDVSRPAEKLHKNVYLKLYIRNVYIYK